MNGPAVRFLLLIAASRNKAGISLPVLLVTALGGAYLQGCIIEDRTPGDAIGNNDDEVSGDDDDDGDETPDASATATQQACESYCEDAMENCTGEYALYSSREICESLCLHFPAGDPDDPDDLQGNTLVCRAEQAHLARTTGEPKVHCPNAGPGGNQRGNNIGCGSDCEAYCYLHPILCDIEGESPLENDECLRLCAGLREKPTFDAVDDHDGEDSLECRLQHLTSASAAPQEHCWHTALAPRPESPCDDLPGAPVPCEVYCDLVTVACTGANQLYDTYNHCLATCEVLPPGTAEDETGDTVACRRYHSYNSTAAPAAHCQHAGPTGDGHCGTENCTSYCTIAQAACGEEFSARYQTANADAGTLGNCFEECMELEGAGADESTYSLNPDVTGDSVGCRALHAVRALLDPQECSAALGGSPCD